MIYRLKGRLCGFICPECPEPLARVNVRLYRSRADQDVTALAVAKPKDTFAILSDAEVKAKQGSLLAETQTDDKGNFEFELGEKQKYQGEAFEVDVYCGTVPHRKPTPRPPTPLQFSVTVIQPQWKRTETEQLSFWEYCLPARHWCAVRARFDAWTICGRLTTCKDKLPIADATVRAFDADWIQDDPLGSGITDGGGHFRIDYTTADFQVTPFSPLINFECVSGPDVYFSVEYAGNPIYTEDRSVGRTPGRENVGHCFCVELCTDQVPHTDPEKLPHWTKVEGFNVHFNADLPHNILPEGYAGTLDGSYTFGGAVALFGNCPFRNNADPTHLLKYRFLIAEWGWPGGGDGTAGVMPTIPPPPAPVPPAPNADWKIVKLSPGTWVGDVYYNDGVNPLASQSVYLSAADQDAEGFVKLDGKSVSVPMAGGGSSNQILSESPGTGNFVRSGLLMHMDSVAVTSAHASRMPAWAGNQTQAGRSLTPAEQEPIRRYKMIFQVRDETTNTDVWVDTLDSIVLDNSNPVTLVYLQELLASACNPITGLNDIHVRYTVDHPHLRYFRLEIRNNNGVVHAAPPPPPAVAPPPPPPSDMPRGDFFPPGNYLFRGGASGPNPPMTNPGGFDVDISSDPMCAYEVRLYWQTRRLYTSEQFINVLYCKE